MHIPRIRGLAIRDRDVRHEHGWKRGCISARKLWHSKVGLIEIRVSLAGSACDFDRCAVHVHLTITNLVEPCPREGVSARSDALRDGKTVRVRVRSGGGIVCSNVPGHIFSRASSLDRVDDHPFRALRCRGIRGKRHLARPTTVYRLA